MAKNAPGEHYRKGITLTALFAKFPTSAAAEAWFAERRRSNGPTCPHCGSDDVKTGCAHKTMPCRRRGKDCRKRFSVKVCAVEADETYVGGKAPNMHARGRERRISGRGGADKATVVGVLDRATNTVVAGPVAATSARTLTGIVDSATADMAGKRLRYDDLIAA
ncbi:MAG: IS1595 family transposase [Acidimicrobiales bacterium]|nr:IS1595 family transposase [Acidimicrobiales bacterium]MYA25664.1 IS1595 family transposase [Acidimicrobiales bacterium]MYB81816.1 IS1595 family transposase [Acidimicrobiales bacterium]MYD82871.1 IS1595 family transposase [Acidimicrobiales bacterium]MYI11895.1 IS1595 family transposase [Acidimicrobiales bacterium]